MLFYTDCGLSKELSEKTKISSLSGQTVYIVPFTGASDVLSGSPAVPSPICHFANIDGKQPGCILLENPRGLFISVTDVYSQVRDKV